MKVEWFFSPVGIKGGLFCPPPNPPSLHSPRLSNISAICDEKTKPSETLRLQKLGTVEQNLAFPIKNLFPFLPLHILKNLLGPFDKVGHIPFYPTSVNEGCRISNHNHSFLGTDCG